SIGAATWLATTWLATETRSFTSGAIVGAAVIHHAAASSTMPTPFSDATATPRRVGRPHPVGVMAGRSASETRVDALVFPAIPISSAPPPVDRRRRDKPAD